MCDRLDRWKRPYILWLGKRERRLFWCNRDLITMKFFQKKNALLKFLRQQQNRFIYKRIFVLIIRDSCSLTFLKQMQINPYICEIFLFSNKANTFTGIEINKYNKINGIYNCPIRNFSYETRFFCSCVKQCGTKPKKGFT